MPQADGVSGSGAGLDFHQPYAGDHLPTLRKGTMMNSLLKLWSVISGLCDSLARTKELIDAANTRAEQALGLDQPVLIITQEEEQPTKRKKAS